MKTTIFVLLKEDIKFTECGPDHDITLFPSLTLAQKGMRDELLKELGNYACVSTEVIESIKNYDFHNPFQVTDDCEICPMCASLPMFDLTIFEREVDIPVAQITIGTTAYSFRPKDSANIAVTTTPVVAVATKTETIRKAYAYITKLRTYAVETQHISEDLSFIEDFAFGEGAESQKTIADFVSFCEGYADIADMFCDLFCMQVLYHGYSVIKGETIVTEKAYEYITEIVSEQTYETLIRIYKGDADTIRVTRQTIDHDYIEEYGEVEGIFEPRGWRWVCRKGNDCSKVFPTRKECLVSMYSTAEEWIKDELTDTATDFADETYDGVQTYSLTMTNGGCIVKRAGLADIAYYIEKIW